MIGPHPDSTYPLSLFQFTSHVQQIYRPFAMFFPIQRPVLFLFQQKHTQTYPPRKAIRLRVIIYIHTLQHCSSYRVVTVSLEGVFFFFLHKTLIDIFFFYFYFLLYGLRRICLSGSRYLQQPPSRLCFFFVSVSISYRVPFMKNE